MILNRKNIFIAIFIFLIISSGCELPAQDNEPEASFYEPFDILDSSLWQVASWSEHGAQTGPERCFVENGKLNMIFINDSNEGYLNAAIQTRDEYLYGTWEARLKPSSVPGVLNSFFTIDWDERSDDSSTSDGTKQEIDIEFLTYTFGPDSGEVHFAVHAQGLNSFNTNPDLQLDFDPSADFHTWGFEITPEYIRWFVDNTTLLTYYYSEHEISITDPYMLKLNVWSRENWINGPPPQDVECIYQIDWIKFTPYGNAKVVPPTQIRLGQ